MLALHQVTVVRGARTLLDGVSLVLEPGRLCAILGPNGAGKSTLIKVAAGEWRPDRGQVSLDGTDLRRLSPRDLAERRAVVPQSTHLSFPFSVGEVVQLGRTVPGFGLDGDAAPARAALHAVGLAGFDERAYVQLSGGERQRVHIARALCQLADPSRDQRGKMLLLDEPTASLDPAHQALVMSALRARAAEGLAIAIVMHDLNLAAAWVDRIVLLAGGRILAQGTPQQALRDATLTEAYGCRMRVGATPEDGGIFVLPHHTRSSSDGLVLHGEPSCRHR